MFTKSIRFKTTLLYSGILLAILVLYNVILLLTVRAILIKEMDLQLSIKAQEIANIFQAYEKIKDISNHPMGILDKLMQEHGTLHYSAIVIDDLWRSEFETLKLKKDYINILDRKGKLLIRSENVKPEISKFIADKFFFSDKNIYIGSVNKKDLNLRIINYPFIYKQRLHLIIQVATNLDSTYQFLEKFLLISSVCIIMIVLLTSFLGSFFVGKILTPVVSVTKAANNITHTGLGTRIHDITTDTEMKQLIDSFNAMIDRLEKSFAHINEFNSYVAHELKTPLAIIKGELELALEQKQENDDTRKILSDCLEETDRMIRITKDLLLLAQLSYKPQILKFKKVNCREFFTEICEHSHMLTSEKNIKFNCNEINENLFINADKVHLRRLFLNIITNAIKYTPKDGNISISAKKEKNDLIVKVSDTGEGIAKEDISKIFDKFFRIDKGEVSQHAGFGLGLSIALSITKAHQGHIAAESEPGKGTTFTITLPLFS